MSESKYRILWRGQISGPFTRDEIETKLAKNEFGVWAEISEGNSDWKPIAEWRIRESAFKPGTKPTSSIDCNTPEQTHRRHIPQKNSAPDLPPLPKTEIGLGQQQIYSTEFVESEPDVDIAKKSFFYWAFLPLRKYAVFKGRACRKEFWGFFLVNFCISFALGLAESYFGIASEYEDSLLAGLYLLIIFLPSTAVSVRRLHDTSRSGFWWWLSITGIGYLILLLFYAQEGAPAENQYGPPVK